MWKPHITMTQGMIINKDNLQNVATSIRAKVLPVQVSIPIQFIL